MNWESCSQSSPAVQATYAVMHFWICSLFLVKKICNNLFYIEKKIKWLCMSYISFKIMFFLEVTKNFIIPFQQKSWQIINQLWRILTKFLDLNKPSMMHKIKTRMTSSGTHPIWQIKPTIILKKQQVTDLGWSGSHLFFIIFQLHFVQPIEFAKINITTLAYEKIWIKQSTMEKYYN